MNMKFTVSVFSLIIFSKNCLSSRLQVSSEVCDDFFYVSLRKAFEATKITDFSLISDENHEIEEKCLVKSLSSEVKIQLESLNSNNDLIGGALSFFIINKSSIQKLTEKLSKENFKVARNFLFWFPESPELSTSTFLLSLWELYISNANVVVKINGAVRMETFLPFTPSGCRSGGAIVTNDFVNQTWVREIFPDKYKNLHGCSIKLSTFDGPPATIITKMNGSTVVTGHNIDLIRGIARTMNFSLEVQALEEPAAWGFIMSNGSSGGVMKRVINRQADVGTGDYYLTLTRAKFMSFSQYGSSQIILVVPDGIPLTPFEKLFSPFNKVVWIILLFMFFSSIALIFGVQRSNPEVQRFVFGSNTGNAFMNFTDIILNGGQPVEPQRNFARTLFMIFVLFCIILRTLYQGALFKFLQTNQRHASVQSIDEIIEKKFDIYMYASFQELSNGLKIHSR